MRLHVRATAGASSVELYERLGERREKQDAPAMTCRPRPLPSLAPSIIPGRSRIWIGAPWIWSVPGTVVRVAAGVERQHRVLRWLERGRGRREREDALNSYAAAIDSVPVRPLIKLDFPTEGKPLQEGAARELGAERLEEKRLEGTHMNPIDAMPVLATSKPTPAPPPPPEDGVRSSRLSLASLALSCPTVARGGVSDAARVHPRRLVSRRGCAHAALEEDVELVEEIDTR